MLLIGHGLSAGAGAPRAPDGTDTCPYRYVLVLCSLPATAMAGRICSRNYLLDGNLETSILGHLISGVRRKIRLNSDEVLLQFNARSARSIL